jgi:hypothetical protein
MIHRILHLTKSGANQLYRLRGAPDCDSAVMFVLARFGGEVLGVDALNDTAPFVFAEQSIGEWTPPLRIFARANIVDPAAEVREFATLDELDARGGGGDEVLYDPTADTFSYPIGSGASPLKKVPNPYPGEVLRGAIAVTHQAEAEWSRY